MVRPKTRYLLGTPLLVMLASTVAIADPPAQVADAQPETSDVAVLPPPTPRWVYIAGGFSQSGVRIVDADSGQMRGTLEAALLSNLALDPKGRYYYVAETMWTKVNRGIRQDMVSIYDAKDLNLLAEVPIPSRLLIGNNIQNFVISANGKLGFVYTMMPSSAILVVDLDKRKMLETVPVPGCAALFPNGPDGVSALCSDGSMATLSFAAGKPSLSKSAPFFSASDDPVYDSVMVDKTKGLGTFLSYTGMLYTVALGSSPQFSRPWSIQVAAGLQVAHPAPLDVNWLPGGHQPFALNRVTGKIYVLMHVGEQWSHKAPAEEIWELDGATHTLISRHPAPGKVTTIQVSQEGRSLVYVGDDDGAVWILDGETLKTKRMIERIGGGNLFVADPS